MNRTDEPNTDWLREPVASVDSVEVTEGFCNFPPPPVGVSVLLLRAGKVRISLERHKSIIRGITAFSPKSDNACSITRQQ